MERDRTKHQTRAQGHKNRLDRTVMARHLVQPVLPDPERKVVCPYMFHSVLKLRNRFEELRHVIGSRSSMVAINTLVVDKLPDPCLLLLVLVL